MKPQIVAQCIVLSRMDYQEADRILTVITPDQGKLRLIAKGVRRPKSKLAGGIELFGINDITVLPSQRDLKTLISSRLLKHYGKIVTDIQRTMLGYEFLKIINKNTEDEPEEAYFSLLENALEGLNDMDVPIELLELWFSSQMLRINGHTPNLMTDTEGNTLEKSKLYLFDFDEMSFREQSGGPYAANHIKLLRAVTGTLNPIVLKQIQNTSDYVPEVASLTKNLLRQNA